MEYSFVVPIIKMEVSNNYRGIAILSCLRKLWSTIINNRLYIWATYQNGKLDSVETCMGCLDQCFRLMTAVESQLSQIGHRKLQGRLFTCFVDFHKDTIQLTLESYGIS